MIHSHSAMLPVGDSFRRRKGKEVVDTILDDAEGMGVTLPSHSRMEIALAELCREGTPDTSSQMER